MASTAAGTSGSVAIAETTQVAEVADTKCWRYFDWSIRLNSWFEALIKADRGLVIDVDRKAATIKESLELVLEAWRLPSTSASVATVSDELFDWLDEMPTPLQTALLRGIAERTEAGLLVRFDWDGGDVWSVTWIDDESMVEAGLAPCMLRGPSKW